MYGRTVSGMLLALLIIGFFVPIFNVRPVRASGTIYIRADGSVDPPDAPISTVDFVIYILTGNITSEADGIVVERNNIIIDGAGYTVRGTKALYFKGIGLTGRSNVVIKNMNIEAFYYGILLGSSSGNSVSGNNITVGNLYGIRLVFSSGNSISGNNITARWEGIHLYSSSGNSVSGNNIANNGYGIWLESSSNNNSVSGNNMTASGLAGIELDSSSGNSVSGNNIANNENGIDLWRSSDNNSVSGNNIANNNIGISIDGSSSNRVDGNMFFSDGLSVLHSYGNVVVNNLVNGKPLVYLESVSDYAVEDAGQVILVGCNRIRVENLNLSHTFSGVQLWQTYNTNVSGNNIANNHIGVYLDSSSGNSISRNNITANHHCGIYTFSISNNSIYYNNFVNNTHQVIKVDSTSDLWDDGYPSGGNYWSDYAGADVKSGVNQDVPGSDGIGDTPYIIDANNKDRYPLMNPWQVYAESLWPMFQHDPQHSGRAPIVGPGVSENPEINMLIGGSVFDSFTAPVISFDGTLYLKALIDGNTGLYAFTPDGTQKWFYPSPTCGYPTVTQDGSIYFYVEVEKYKNMSLRMISSDGNLKWEQSFVGAYPVGYPAVDSNGIIYFLASSTNGESGKLVALDPDTGNVLWTYEVQGYLGQQTPAVDQNGVIYFGRGDTLFAIDPNGTEKWRRIFVGEYKYLPPTTPSVCTPSIADDGTIYTVVRTERDYRTLQDQGYLPYLHAINPENPQQDKWVWGTNREIEGPPSISQEGNVYIWGGIAPAGQLISYLYGFDSEGNNLPNWPLNLGYIGRANLLVVDNAGIIYGLFGDHTVKAFYGNGTQIWSLYLQERRYGSLSIGKGSTLYVPGSKWLYAIQSTPADFSVAASPASLTIQQGSSSSSTITITSLNGFDQLVFLTVSGMPPGVMASFDLQFVVPPAGGSETSTLTVTVDGTAPLGSYTLTVTGTSGALTHSTYISLEITSAPPPPNPPTLVSPGSSSSPGEEIYTLTPTFTWNSVPGADQYGLYIRDMESNELVFDSQVRGITIAGTSYTLPSGILKWGTHYRWNMNSHNEAGWGEFSPPLYLHTVSEWTFAVITDLHIGFGYPDYGSEGYNDESGQDYYLTERLNKIVESINNNPAIRFVVVLGDISDSAEKSEFLKAREILNRLNAPYIPLIGNHDVWPYTQDAEQTMVDKSMEIAFKRLVLAAADKIPLDQYDPDVREGYEDKSATFASGDAYFAHVFWETNRENVEKIEALFGTSWKRQFTSFHELRETGSMQILQNYVFTYNGIKFIALDCNERGLHKSGARLYDETEEWLRDNLGENEPTIVLAHHPVIYCDSLIGLQCFSMENLTRIRDIIGTSKAKLLACFGGHSHANFYAEAGMDRAFTLVDPIVINGIEVWQGSTLVHAWNGLSSDVVITESVCRESIKWGKRLAELAPEHASEFPLRTETGYCIRPVTVLGNEVGYRVVTSISEDDNLPPTSCFYYDGKNPTTFKAFPFDPDPPWEDAKWSFIYSWSFVEGTTDLQRVREVEHEYASAGDYEVTLTVTDEGGASSSFSGWVTVPSPSHPWWKIWGKSPIDLVVTDPEGFTITKDSGEVAGMSYKQLDVDGDGDQDDVVEIWEQKTGDYHIVVVPESDAEATETYTLEIFGQDVIMVLAENVRISDIPTEPYIISSTALDIPPTTLLTIGDPKFVVNSMAYLSSSTPIMLVAEDNPGGSGVASTAYRIYNASYDSGWKTYTYPFLLIGLSDGVYHIDYNSTDYAGNVELTHTIQVTLFSWNYIFTDTYGRGTTLKINIAYKFFQFITPDKDYGIIKATYMRQSGRAIIISHLDKQLQLVTIAVDTKIDFCVAVAWDRQTRKQYFLVDKPGTEN